MSDDVSILCEDIVTNIEGGDSRRQFLANMYMLRNKEYYEESGFIYLAKDEYGLTKIGRSRNVTVRIRMLNVESASTVQLIGSYPCKDMRLVEHLLHKRYTNFRKRGEWFDLSDELIIEIDDILRVS